MENELTDKLNFAKTHNGGVWVDLVKFSYSDSKFSILQGTQMLLYNLRLTDGRIQSSSYDLLAPMFCKVFTTEDYYEAFEVVDSTKNFHLK